MRNITFTLLLAIFFVMPSAFWGGISECPIINITYTLSGGPADSAEGNPVPDLEKLVRKPIAGFSKDLKKENVCRTLLNAPEERLRYVNAILEIKDIHAEYSHDKRSGRYTTKVRFSLEIRTPGNGAYFTKGYSGTSNLKLGAQWAEWVGINKTFLHAFDEVLKKIMNDSEFREAVSAVKKDSFYEPAISGTGASEVGSKMTPPARSTEERLRTLESLREKGLITEEEYRVKRSSILKEL